VEDQIALKKPPGHEASLNPLVLLTLLVSVHSVLRPHQNEKARLAVLKPVKAIRLDHLLVQELVSCSHPGEVSSLTDSSAEETGFDSSCVNCAKKSEGINFQKRVASVILFHQPDLTLPANLEFPHRPTQID